MWRLVIALFLLLAWPAAAQSPGTVNLVGPSTSPGAPQITPQAINDAVNAALARKLDFGPINNTSIGSTTPGTGAFTTLTASTLTTVYAANYGVTPDRVDATADLNITASATTATTTTTSFKSTDCQTGSGCTGTHGNKIILITGAGTSGYALLTTIAGFTNTHAVTLANAAVTTVTNANFSYASNAVQQINAAISDATARYPTGAKVELPSGAYIINPAVGRVLLASNMSLEPPGRGGVNVICASLADDATQELNACIFGTGLTNIAVKNLTIKGVGDLTPTRPAADFGAPILIENSTNVEVSGNRLSYVRSYTIEVSGSTTVTIDNNFVSYVFSAATGCGGCGGDVRITNNHIDHSADAAIAVSTGDAQASPSGIRNLVVTGNSITESVGIQVSGGRSMAINDNTFIRAIGQAMRIFPYTAFNSGDTATTLVSIVGNTVQDVINAQTGNAQTASYNAYLIIGGGQRQAGTVTSVPGYPTVSTGVVTDLYGTNTSGNFFISNTSPSTVPTPGSIAWNISNNMLIRTLPAVATYSQWGYGTTCWGCGQNGGQYVNTYTGPIAEADLQMTCILIREAALRLSAIHDNICATTGAHGINFLATNPKNGDYDGLRIYNNTFYDYADGIAFQAVAGSSSQIDIENNNFDLDPRFRDPNRGTGGTWAVNAGSIAINDAFVSGLRINRNKYRNLNHPYYFGTGPIAVWVGPDETIFGLPVAAGYSSSNIGVGTVSEINGANNLFRLVCEDDNPTSATFGQITAVTGLAQSVMPSTGCWLRGTFVASTQPTSDLQGRVTTGWQRLTTNSSSNVLDTDWRQVYSTPSYAGTLGGIRNVTGTSDTVLSTDMGKAVTYSNGSPIAVTLPQAGSTGFELNKCFSIVNIGAGLVTVTPTSSLINGGATKTFATGVGSTVCSGGGVANNYLAY